jgi:raffinose/stachyose/melibiose transport system permease protein
VTATPRVGAAAPARRGQRSVGTGAGSRGAGSPGPSAWLAAPALVFFGLFAIVPLLGVVALSFTQWDGLGTPTFVGFDNWPRVLGDPVTQNGLKLTILLTVATLVIQGPIALLLGVFMAGRQRYRELLSILYFLPLLFSAAAVGITFKALLDPNFGLGQAFGWDWLNQDWLGRPELVIPALLFVINWCFVPFHSLLYQGAARQIPASLYEAARIDGAGRVRTFFSITLPQMRSTIITSATLQIVGSLTYFDLIFVMTNGGPGNATRVLPLDMYLRGFRSYDMGGASVVGVVIVALGLLVSFLLNRLTGNTRMESQMEGV